MRIESLRWFLRSRKCVKIPLTGGLCLFILTNFIVVESNESLHENVTGNHELVRNDFNPKSLRRHSVEDDEIHESELVRAAILSLSEWNERKKKRSVQRRVKRDEEMVCYGELGCFRDEGPFDYLDMLPSSPDEISTRFMLYTRANRLIPETFSYFNYTAAMPSSHFNATSPTKVIIHGFGSTCNRIWASEMRLTLLSVVDCNVICVDWENGATLPNYVRAAVNTRLVGKQVALLISWLNEQLGSKTQDFHLIGFSLGAHVAGFAGQDLKNLSRITGLDPAGPLYESYDKKVRLDSSDALFVDVIHSNGDSLLMGGLGSWEPMGHVDFYPNGGRVQKGCSNLFLGAVRDFLWSGSDVDGRSLCNHRRAYKFFTESISPRCPFPAFACESYEKFIAGSCFTWDTTRCGNMGYFADRLPNPKQGLLYLVTREDEPFCANQYRLTLESSPSSAPISTYGGIEAVLIGHDFINETFLITKTRKENMVPGAILQRMLVAHPAITEPVQIQLKYKAYQGWLYSGISRWSMDSLVLTNAYGKSVSFCARLLLPSGIPVTIRLSPGICLNKFPSQTPSIGRPMFPPTPFDPHPATSDTTNAIYGSPTLGPNDTAPARPTMSENEDAAFSIMKPPPVGLIPVGNNFIHNNQDQKPVPVGPPYEIQETGQWEWHPISPIQQGETTPPIEEESVTIVPTEAMSPSQSPTEDEIKITELPIVKMRICLIAEGEANYTNGLNNVTLRNMTCVQPDEDSGPLLPSNDPVMSNNALGQIASYHQEVMRENELFQHGNTVDVESLNEEYPTSTDMTTPMSRESFWVGGHNETVNPMHGSHHIEVEPNSSDSPMPPHLSYILKQLESQGLGPGPKIPISPHHEGGNFLGGLLERGRAQTPVKVTRRLVPSSRALKMRPVSLTAPPATGVLTHRRQSKILDLNFSPSAPEGYSHFTSRQGLRWLLPPPPRSPYVPSNNSPVFYVTRIPQLQGKGYYLMPHYAEMGTNGGGRVRFHRTLQPQNPLPNETPPQPIKTYFEDFRKLRPPLPRFGF